MKKFFSYIALGFLVSCRTGAHQEYKKPLYEVLTQQSDGGARIRFFEFLTETREIKMLQNDPKLRRKIKPEDLSASNFVVLNMGEKETTGYTIQVDQVSETQDSIVITIKDVPPASQLLPEKDIYYTPFTVVKINSKKPIRFN